MSSRVRIRVTHQVTCAVIDENEVGRVMEARLDGAVIGWIVRSARRCALRWSAVTPDDRVAARCPTRVGAMAALVDIAERSAA